MNTSFVYTQTRNLNIGYNNLFNDKESSINLGIHLELRLFKKTCFNLELNYKKYFNLQNKALRIAKI